MLDSAPEDGWLHIGLDDDGAPLFIDSRSVRMHGLRLDRLEVTVIVKPAEESDGFRALQELLMKAGKSCEEAAYIEQYWVLHLPRKLFAIRRLSVKRRDGATLHSMPLSSIDLCAIEPGSAAECVSLAVERLVQDHSVVLQIPVAGLSPEAPRSRISSPLNPPPANLHREVTSLPTPRQRTRQAARRARRVASTGIWARFLRRLRG